MPGAINSRGTLRIKTAFQSQIWEVVIFLRQTLLLLMEKKKKRHALCHTFDQNFGKAGKRNQTSFSPYSYLLPDLVYILLYCFSKEYFQRQNCYVTLKLTKRVHFLGCTVFLVSCDNAYILKIQSMLICIHIPLQNLYSTYIYHLRQDKNHQSRRMVKHQL